MESLAKAKHLKQSPYKVRQILDLVRGKNVNEAINILRFTNKKAAKAILKTLNSAIANLAVSDEPYDVDDFYVKTAFVDGGPMMKRWRAAAMGRAVRILKRTSHLTIIISQKGTN
jgi:large subunit ribosomal protein L22